MRAFTIIAICGLTSAIRLTAQDDITLDDLLEAAFNLVDENGNGEVCIDEGMAAATKVRDVLVDRGILEEGEVDDRDLEEGLEWIGEMCDDDGNGAVSLDEMVGGIDAMMGDLELDEEDIAAMAVSVADVDGNGEIDLEEAMGLMADLEIDVDEADVLELGKQLDLNGSGGICADELLNL